MNADGRIHEFLKARREGLTPQDVGLPWEVEWRRVPGLRREEVARLAAVSVDYYTRLEQGRAQNVSDQVLNAVADALKLDDLERAHLTKLARHQQPNRTIAGRGADRADKPGLSRDRPCPINVIAIPANRSGFGAFAAWLSVAFRRFALLAEPASAAAFVLGGERRRSASPGGREHPRHVRAACVTEYQHRRPAAAEAHHSVRIEHEIAGPDARGGALAVTRDLPRPSHAGDVRDQLSRVGDHLAQAPDFGGHRGRARGTGWGVQVAVGIRHGRSRLLAVVESAT